jgi:(E)-4-hydroxy-3-methylbut-2-enyl-diphosphate synthase
MFNLQTVIARIKARTSHLKGLKIGIMGCIVNGPGEMADADYGYVGAGRGKISLYKKKECVQRNIPEDEAVDKLIDLIKEYGDWHE